MDEKDLDKIAELFFNAYEEKHIGVDLSPEGMSKCFYELSSTLNMDQKKLLSELENLEIEAYIIKVKAAIKYIIKLLCPGY